MSTAPLAILYLALDADYDPVFAANTALTGQPAVVQAILTRLKLFQGEWWENLNLGLPVFQSMLAQLGTQRTQQAAQRAVAANIATLSPYVTSVNNVSVSLNGAGQLSIQVSVQTAFGLVAVQTAPGASAVI